MLVNAEQLLNALLPIAFKDAGSVTLVSAWHSRNAPYPISVSVPGREMLASFSQLANALLPIRVTPSGITTEVILSKL